jgi:hypothetical protein
MIEIVEYKSGTCQACGKKPAEYAIRAPQAEWDGPGRVCQVCMISFAENNSLIRAVLLIQSGTRE